MVSSYKSLVLSACINNLGFFLIFLTSSDSYARKLQVTFLNSIFWTISYKSISNWLSWSFFGGVLTDLKPKLVVISFVDSFLFSKKNVLHLILLIKLSSLCVCFYGIYRWSVMVCFSMSNWNLPVLLLCLCWIYWRMKTKVLDTLLLNGPLINTIYAVTTLK